MTLLDILNDETKSAEISSSINAKLADKNFWKVDEKRYIDVLEEIKKDYNRIKMSYEKFIKRFGGVR